MTIISCSEKKSSIWGTFILTHAVFITATTTLEQEYKIQNGITDYVMKHQTLSSESDCSHMLVLTLFG